MKAKKSRKGKIEPKRYGEILRGIELHDIFLKSCSAEIKREKLEKTKGLKVSIKDKVDKHQSDNKVVVTHKFFLNAKPSEEEKDFVIKISVAFCLVYTSSSPLEDDFFDVFKEMSLPVNSWPYFREFIQSMTQRMNIPPLTLPLVKRA